MDGQSLISKAFITQHVLDAARTFEQLKQEDQLEFLSTAPDVISARLLNFSDPALSARLLSLLPVRQSAEILVALTTDVSVLFLRRMEEQFRLPVLDAIPESTARMIKQLLTYPPDCAGAMMDPQVFTLPDDITIAEARTRIFENATHIISYIYTLDRSRLLKGFINFRDLLTDRDTKKLSGISKKCEWVLTPYQRISQVLKNPGWQEHHALPVVDDQSVFLGVIGYRTLRSLQKAEEGQKSKRSLTEVGTALGELYGLGIFGLIRGFSSVFPDKTK
jgi:magnesium transporter